MEQSHAQSHNNMDHLNYITNTTVKNHLQSEQIPLRLTLPPPKVYEMSIQEQIVCSRDGEANVFPKFCQHVSILISFSLLPTEQKVQHTP